MITRAKIFEQNSWRSRQLDLKTEIRTIHHMLITTKIEDIKVVYGVYKNHMGNNGGARIYTVRGLYPSSPVSQSSIKCPSLISLPTAVRSSVLRSARRGFGAFLPNSYSGMTSLLLRKLGFAFGVSSPAVTVLWKTILRSPSQALPPPSHFLLACISSRNANAAAVLLLSFMSLTSANEYLVHLCGCSLKSGALCFAMMRHGGISGLTNILSLPRNRLVSKRPPPPPGLTSARPPRMMSSASAATVFAIFDPKSFSAWSSTANRLVRRLRNSSSAAAGSCQDDDIGRARPAAAAGAAAATTAGAVLRLL